MKWLNHALWVDEPKQARAFLFTAATRLLIDRWRRERRFVSWDATVPDEAVAPAENGMISGSAWRSAQPSRAAAALARLCRGIQSRRDSEKQPPSERRRAVRDLEQSLGFRRGCESDEFLGFAETLGHAAEEALRVRRRSRAIAFHGEARQLRSRSWRRSRSLPSKEE